jgi:hypothetical protein
MAFGVEEKKVPLPYVETQNIKFGVTTEFPKWKYHKKYPQGIIVNSAEEEAAIGEGWTNGLLELGIETCPSVDATDKVALRLAEIRSAVAATK